MDITVSPLKWTLCSENFGARNDTSSSNIPKRSDNYLFITGINNNNNNNNNNVCLFVPINSK